MFDETNQHTEHTSVHNAHTLVVLDFFFFSVGAFPPRLVRLDVPVSRVCFFRLHFLHVINCPRTNVTHEYDVPHLIAGFSVGFHLENCKIVYEFLMEN